MKVLKCSYNLSNLMLFIYVPCFDSVCSKFLCASLYITSRSTFVWIELQKRVCYISNEWYFMNSVYGRNHCTIFY